MQKLFASKVSELGSILAIGGIGKKVRREIDDVFSPSTSKKSKYSATEPVIKQVQHSHSHQVNYGIMDKVSLYKMKVDTLVALGAPDEKINAARTRLLQELDVAAPD